jgi:hypothetical protein
MDALRGTQGNDNFGSIRQAWYIPTDHIISFPRPDKDFVLHAPIPSLPGTLFYEIEFKFETGKFTEETSESPAGELSKCSVDFFVPYTSQAKNTLLKEWKRRRFVLILLDYNELPRIVGDNISGLHLKITENVLDKISGENGYRLSFTGEFSHRTYTFM